MPLLHSISAESLARLQADEFTFDAQGISNTAWAFARIMLRDSPLLDALSAAALPNLRALLGSEAQEAYAFLWAIWRIGEPDRLLLEWRRSALSPNGVMDALVRSLLLAVDAWHNDAVSELCLEAWISATLPRGSLTYVISCIGPAAIHETLPSTVIFQSDEACSHFYQRLSRLLDATAGVASSPEDVLYCIESFGHVSSWLKVAGDAKAEVLADAINRRSPTFGECTLELGAFVGYSAIRFARQVCTIRGGWCLCGVSLEIDPVHAAVSRHHLDRAGLSFAAEIWVGQLQDTMARVVEAVGKCSLAFVFMDQRGTTFHEDLSQLEGMPALAPASHVTADNTVKPGSPVYNWHVSVGACRRFSTIMWAMSEFALGTIEDWQAVSLVLGEYDT